LTKKQNLKYKKRFKQEQTAVMAASRNSYAVEFSSKVSKEEKDDTGKNCHLTNSL
jgi:hypothetical protein